MQGQKLMYVRIMVRFADYMYNQQILTKKPRIMVKIYGFEWILA